MQNSTHSTRIARDDEIKTQSSALNLAILDQPIPRYLRRALARRDPPLIRKPTKKELKRLQKQFKTNVVTRRGSGYVPLPDWINRKKDTVNIQNNDNLCFLYAVESELHDSVSTNPRFYERTLIQNYRPWFDMMPNEIK